MEIIPVKRHDIILVRVDEGSVGLGVGLGEQVHTHLRRVLPDDVFDLVLPTSLEVMILRPEDPPR